MEEIHRIFCTGDSVVAFFFHSASCILFVLSRRFASLWCFGRVAQTFIPEGSGPLAVLSELGFRRFLLALRRREGSAVPPTCGKEGGGGAFEARAGGRCVIDALPPPPPPTGCGLNYHKRCAFSIPNNCSGARKRRLSSTSLASGHSVRLGTSDSLPCTADELVRGWGVG